MPDKDLVGYDFEMREKARNSNVTDAFNAIMREVLKESHASPSGPVTLQQDTRGNIRVSFRANVYFPAV